VELIYLFNILQSNKQTQAKRVNVKSTITTLGEQV